MPERNVCCELSMLSSSRASVRRTMFRYQVYYVLIGSLVALSVGALRHFDDFPFSGKSFWQAPTIAVSLPQHPAAIDGPLQTADKSYSVSVHALTRRTIELMHDAPLKPTFSQFAETIEAGLVLEPALPADASVRDPAQLDQSSEPGQIAASSVPQEPHRPKSIAEAMTEPSHRAPEMASVPVPLPVPRPADLRPVEPQPQKVQRPVPIPASAPGENTAVASLPADNRSFIEKLFGATLASPSDSALRHASLGNSTGSIAPDASLSPVPNLKVDATTAIYDISAKVIIMPSGERLEAHSGLGEMMDDPRFVHVRMKGATPPGTYILSEREALFHGVRALRMSPVGGSGAIFGRAGILTHPFMLGPTGDSNGCVSIKDHERFLQAYLRGEIKRMVVVLGRGLDALPRLAAAR